MSKFYEARGTALEECGCCGNFHFMSYRGDCHNDAERFTADGLDAQFGEGRWYVCEETLQVFQERLVEQEA